MLRFVFLSGLTLAASFATAADPNYYLEAKALYDGAVMPEWTDFPKTRVLAGTTSYVNRPTAQVAMRHLDYVKEGAVYTSNYFTNGPAANWQLPDFVRSFEKVMPSYFPLEPDTAELALRTGLLGGKTVHYWRKVAADDGTFLVEKFVCVAQTGCDLPFSGVQIFHYPPLEAISYAYFKIE